MSDSTIRVVARFIAKADKVDALKSLLLSIIEPTRAESGNISYELLQNLGEPTDFTFVEEWTDKASLDAHSKAPHLAAALGKLDGLLGAAPDIRRYVELK